MDSSGTTESRLRAHVGALAGTIGERHVLRPHALAAAADYIDAAWRVQGYAPECEAFTVDGIDCANLVITWPGRLNEILLIGAHYDTVRGSPGADDNASGVAALLELSRAFAQLEPERTVRFAAFTNEEPPFHFTKHMGSVVHAKAARARGERIALMISLEMLGYFDDRPGIEVFVEQRVGPPGLKDRGGELGIVDRKQPVPFGGCGDLAELKEPVGIPRNASVRPADTERLHTRSGQEAPPVGLEATAAVDEDDQVCSPASARFVRR